MMKKLFAGVAALFLIGGAAYGQAVTPVPQVQNLNQNDLVQVIPQGQPSAQSVYIVAPAIAGLEDYSYQIPLTAFAITVPAHTSLMYLNPAGTLATGAFTMEPTPSDGQHVCFEDTQIQTAVTISANTGQTILTSIGLGAVTAFVANTRYCYFYNRPLAGWIRYT